MTDLFRDNLWLTHRMSLDFVIRLGGSMSYEQVHTVAVDALAELASAHGKAAEEPKGFVDRAREHIQRAFYELLAAGAGSPATPPRAKETKRRQASRPARARRIGIAELLDLDVFEVNLEPPPRSSRLSWLWFLPAGVTLVATVATML